MEARENSRVATALENKQPQTRMVSWVIQMYERGCSDFILMRTPKPLVGATQFDH